MLPFSLKLGPFTISPVELTALLGVAIAALIVRKRMELLTVRPADLFDIALAGLIGGAVGAKLFHLLPLWIRGEQTARDLLADWGRGSAFYGGIIGGTLAAMAVLLLKKLPVLRVVDTGFSVVPVGFAVGKLGCFLAGCCYGRACLGTPGVQFAPGSLAYQTQVDRHLISPAAAHSLPVHPTQLYELAFSLVLFAVLSIIFRRSRRAGETTLAWFVLYAAWRFGIEFLRDDPDRHVFGAAALSDSQIVALAVGTVAALAWIWLRRRPESEPPPSPETAETSK